MFGLNFLLFGRNPDIEFTTPLSVDECQKRLAQELQRKKKIFSLRPPPPVVERLRGNLFLISRNNSWLYRDNFLVLDGQLKAVGDGTLVRAAFRLYGGFSIILLLGFGVFLGMAANDVVSNGAEIGILFIPIVFFGLVWLFVGIAWWLGRSNRDGLSAYLQSILVPMKNSN